MDDDEDSDDFLLSAAALAIVVRRRRRRRNRRRRLLWSRQWLIDRSSERGMVHYVLTSSRKRFRDLLVRTLPRPTSTIAWVVCFPYNRETLN